MDNVIWVDENDNVLGEVDRKKADEEGLLHRVVAIYLINDKDEILVNELAKRERLDHSSAGHVDIGESYLEAAKRELEEELGVAGVALQEIGSVQDNMHIFRVYVCHAIPIKLKEDEVKNVFWAKPEDIEKDMQENPEKYTGGFKITLRLFLSKLN